MDDKPSQVVNSIVEKLKANSNVQMAAHSVCQLCDDFEKFEQSEKLMTVYNEMYSEIKEMSGDKLPFDQKRMSDITKAHILSLGFLGVERVQKMDFPELMTVTYSMLDIINNRDAILRELLKGVLLN
jgi:hypothetical protein